MMSVPLCALRAEIEGGEALIKAAAAGQLDAISEVCSRGCAALRVCGDCPPFRALK